MLEQQDFSAIAAIINQALQPIKNDIHTLQDDMAYVKGEIKILQDDMAYVKGEIKILQDDMAYVKGEIKILQDDMAYVKGEIKGLQNDMAYVKGEIKILQDDMAYVKGEIKILQDDTSYVKDDMQKMHLFLENDIRTKINILAEGHISLNSKLDAIIAEQKQQKYTQDIFDLMLKGQSSRIARLSHQLEHLPCQRDHVLL